MIQNRWKLLQQRERQCYQIHRRSLRVRSIQTQWWQALRSHQTQNLLLRVGSARTQCYLKSTSRSHQSSSFQNHQYHQMIIHLQQGQERRTLERLDRTQEPRFGRTQSNQRREPQSDQTLPSQAVQIQYLLADQRPGFVQNRWKLAVQMQERLVQTWSLQPVQMREQLVQTTAYWTADRTRRWSPDRRQGQQFDQIQSMFAGQKQAQPSDRILMLRKLERPDQNHQLQAVARIRYWQPVQRLESVQSQWTLVAQTQEQPTGRMQEL
jgi:hypothetical protein